MRPPADDADRLIATLSSTYGLCIVQTRETAPDGDLLHVVTTRLGVRTLTIKHETRLGAALELAERLGFDVTDG